MLNLLIKYFRLMLTVYGPEAVEMLSGEVELNPHIFFSALAAASILTEKDTPKGMLKTRKHLLSASADFCGGAAKTLDFSTTPWPTDSIGQADHLNRLVLMAAVKRHMPKPVQQSISRTLKQARKEADCKAVATSMLRKLHVSSRHPVRTFLTALV